MNDGTTFELHGMRASVTDGALVVVAASIPGRGALGAEELVVPLGRIVDLRFKAASLLVNGSLVVEWDGAAVQLRFRRKQSSDAEALLRVLDERRARSVGRTEIAAPVVVQVESLDRWDRSEGVVGDLPAWVDGLGPHDDRRGCAFAWRPATPAQIGDVAVDEGGRTVVVVGRGRHGYDGPVRDVVEHLPENVIVLAARRPDEGSVAAVSAAPSAPKPRAGYPYRSAMTHALHRGCRRLVSGRAHHQGV